MLKDDRRSSQYECDIVMCEILFKDYERKNDDYKRCYETQQPNNGGDKKEFFERKKNW
jgi:hypothetical protein